MGFLESITKESPHTINFEATRGEQFGKQVITAQSKLRDIIAVFEVDSNVQRELDSNQVASIKRYILDKLKRGNSPIFFPPFVFSSRGYGEFDEKESAYKLKLNNKIAVLDGQHRLEAFKDLEFRLKDSQYPEEQLLYEKLKEIPLTLQIYEGLNIEQEQQLFTDINAMNTRVSANLIKYYDEDNLTSKLMRNVVHNHPSIAYEQFETRKNTTRIKLMTGLTVYRLIAVLHSGRIISNQVDYEFSNSDYNKLEEKIIQFLNLLVKYIASPNVYDRDQSIYLNKSVLLAIGKAIYEIKDISKWEVFFKEVVFVYDWSHGNKDLLNARVAYNHISKRFRLTPESKVVNPIYIALHNRWRERVF